MLILKAGVYLDTILMIMYLGYISNDERPEFSKMLQDIDDGKVDIILAKDLSRIGRKGSRTLTFIDELKEKNVNLILTKDTFGEFNLLEGDDDLLGLSTWFNERYVKEVSKSKNWYAQTVRKRNIASRYKIWIFKNC